MSTNYDDSGGGNLPYMVDEALLGVHYEDALTKPQYIPNLYATWAEIQHIFAREMDARIIDLATGYEFNIRRSFGTHHADVEPLTVADADIMRGIWGGYSWARRPVAVYVAGEIFPASLTFSPHAGRDDAPALAVVDNRSGGYGRGVNMDTVKGNSINGIICLHFYGSLLHGSLRSNPDHQNAVAQAREILRNKYATPILMGDAIQ